MLTADDDVPEMLATSAIQQEDTSSFGSQASQQNSAEISHKALQSQSGQKSTAQPWQTPDQPNPEIALSKAKQDFALWLASAHPRPDYIDHMQQQAASSDINAQQQHADHMQQQAASSDINAQLQYIDHSHQQQQQQTASSDMTAQPQPVDHMQQQNAVPDMTAQQKYVEYMQKQQGSASASDAHSQPGYAGPQQQPATVIRDAKQMHNALQDQNGFAYLDAQMPESRLHFASLGDWVPCSVTLSWPSLAFQACLDAVLLNTVVL